MKKLIEFLKSLEGVEIFLKIGIICGMFTVVITNNFILELVTAILVLISVGINATINKLIGIKIGADHMTQEVIKLLDNKIANVKKQVAEQINKITKQN